MLWCVLRLVPRRFKLDALIYFSVHSASEGWLLRFADRHPLSYGRFRTYVCAHICTFFPDCYVSCPVRVAEATRGIVQG